jgi:hypothetical protein
MNGGHANGRAFARPVDFAHPTVPQYQIPEGATATLVHPHALSVGEIASLALIETGNKRREPSNYESSERSQKTI